jgi:hypothetical protein
MKKTATFLLLLVALQAHADFTLMYEVVENYPNSNNVTKNEYTIYMQGNKARQEETAHLNKTLLFDTIGIIDFDTGETYSLSKSNKTFTKFGPNELREWGAKRNREEAKQQPRIIDTGRNEKVGEYNAEVYTVGNNTFWVTKEIPNYAVILAALKRMALQEGVKNNLVPVYWKIDGFPVKTKIMAATTALVSLKQDPVDESLFAPPADYRQTAPVYR